MEDAHTALLKLDESKSDEEADAFFAVYDGHGGEFISVGKSVLGHPHSAFISVSGHAGQNGFPSFIAAFLNCIFCQECKKNGVMFYFAADSLLFHKVTPSVNIL